MVLDLGKDRNVRRGSGKRSTTKTDLKQGRYVRAEMPKIKVEDLAFDATIRAAAPFQKRRKLRSGRFYEFLGRRGYQRRCFVSRRDR